MGLLLATVACSPASEVQITAFIVDGLQVIYKQTPGNPVAAAGLYLKGGMNYMGPRQAGIERFLFEVARGGTESLSKDDLNAQLEALGTKFNTAATYDYTALTFRCIRDNFEASWELFTDIFLHPRFANEELELVRERIVAAIEAEDELPGRQVKRVASDLYYEGHPYGVSLFGIASAVTSLSRKDLVQYHRSDITKNRLLLVIVGDLGIPSVTKKARDLARQLAPGPDLRLPTLNFLSGSPDLAVAERNLSAHYILGLFDAPRPGHPDYPAFTAATRILSDRLSGTLRTDHGLTTEASAGAGRLIANHGYIFLTSTEPNRSLRAIFRTIDGVILDPVPDEQLQAALTSSVTRYLLDNESSADQMGQLAMWEIVGEGWEKGEQFLPELNAVRANDIQMVLRKYMRNVHFGVVGSRRAINRQLFTSR